MNIADVFDEIAAAIEAEIPGLRCPGYPAAAPVPPVALFGWPDEVQYDLTFARGCDGFTLPVLVIAGPTDSRANFALLGAYMSGTGTKSIKRALEASKYPSCDSVRVAKARVEEIQLSGRDMVAAVFDAEIVGKGA